MANRVVDRRLDSYGTRAVHEGVTGFLPVDEVELRHEIAWQALSDHARSDDELAAVCALARAELRHELHAATLRDLDETRVDALMALVDGLWHVMTRADHPLTLDRARTALELALPALVEPAPLREWPLGPWESWAAEFWVA